MLDVDPAGGQDVLHAHHPHAELLIAFQEDAVEVFGGQLVIVQLVDAAFKGGVAGLTEEGQNGVGQLVAAQGLPLAVGQVAIAQGQIFQTLGEDLGAVDGRLQLT